MVQIFTKDKNQTMAVPAMFSTSNGSHELTKERENRVIYRSRGGEQEDQSSGL
jgi:hypothetical protein